MMKGNVLQRYQFDRTTLPCGCSPVVLIGGVMKSSEGFMWVWAALRGGGSGGRGLTSERLCGSFQLSIGKI